MRGPPSTTQKSAAVRSKTARKVSSNLRLPYSRTHANLLDITEDRLSLILSGWNNFEADFEILASTLDAVGEVYPFVKGPSSIRGRKDCSYRILVAVLPFKVAVTVELKRRQNDKKILALFVTMRDMMSVLAQYVHGTRARNESNIRTSSAGSSVSRSLCERLTETLSKTRCNSARRASAWTSRHALQPVMHSNPSGQLVSDLIGPVVE